ncbi:SAM-dependent methyltransferase [Burkholderia diffusa]|uniref:SAM-dependent methyltransferase n=1 Tax=Burkholderia diffusa TaxID=488732 RepID=A0AAW3P818_9BURK|nr:class I SAM-dependent methyltransferase [Burkholderia diffusa]KWF33742.1 SAM-dependent methyltransferase [Burkholderia diffusa]KWF34065.1 SAM-dependent methyltransferase [Burkholderia diffusa]KWF44153.1 SAM-dependent methyltransferase [Burkholderia diffusa]KWF54068.1 SAM-dependent methyltransferase [Burkholderia diffusa]
MTQNIYDDPAFFEGYSRLNRSVQGLDGAPEWPALRALLPALRGLNVLDLGCGYGWFSRWAADHGAASVLGIDVSERMLARAASTAAHPAITYRRADLETLALPDAAFDLAYSSLAFHYIARLDTLLRTIHRALAPGARLVFSIEHPIYTAPRRPGFVVDAHGARSWPIDGYQREGERVTDWLAPGVVKQHRTLGTLVNLLIESGFTLTHLNEWGPTPEQLAAMPALEEERDRPMMAIVAAQR